MYFLGVLYYPFDNKLTNKQDKMLTYNHDSVNVQLIYLPTVVGFTSYDKEHKMLVIYYLASARINGHTVISSWCITIVRLYLTLLLCATFIIF